MIYWTVLPSFDVQKGALHYFNVYKYRSKADGNLVPIISKNVKEIFWNKFTLIAGMIYQKLV